MPYMPGMQLRLAYFGSRANATHPATTAVKFPAQLLSILRLSQSEHAHAIPVDMIGGYGHVAFVLDALLYYLKRRSPGKGASCVLRSGGARTWQ
jgi:hypothetical protein